MYATSRFLLSEILGVYTLCGVPSSFFLLLSVLLLLFSHATRHTCCARRKNYKPATASGRRYIDDHRRGQERPHAKPTANRRPTGRRGLGIYIARRPPPEAIERARSTTRELIHVNVDLLAAACIHTIRVCVPGTGSQLLLGSRRRRSSAILGGFGFLTLLLRGELCLLARILLA